MYLSSIDAPRGAQGLPHAVQRAVDFLRHNDISAMEPGEYPIEGTRIFAKVFDLTTKTVAETLPEVHDRYIDIQFWANGEEMMGYAPRLGQETAVRSNPEEDIAFVENVQDERFVFAHTGDFMVLYPWDVHRPGIQVTAPVTLRKAVVKVSVDLV